MCLGILKILYQHIRITVYPYPIIILVQSRQSLIIIEVNKALSQVLKKVHFGACPIKETITHIRNNAE